MSRMIYFYNVGIYKNNEKTNLNFNCLLEQINFHEVWLNKVRKTKQGPTAMFPYYEEHSKKIVPMGKFRVDYQPYVGQINSSELKDIRDIEQNADIVEISNFVYDSDNRLLILENNPQGIKKRDIEQYFNTYLPKEEDNLYEVKLHEVKQKNNIDDIKKSKQVRYIEIKMDPKNFNENVLIVREENRMICELLDNLIQGTNSFEPNVLTLEIKSSNGKKGTIDLKYVKKFLASINLEHNFFKGIKVRYRNNETEELDTMKILESDVNLKTRILNDSNLDNPGSQYIGLTIINEMENYMTTILNSKIEFEKDCINAVLPELVMTPKDEDKIDTNSN